ncbi:MAG: phosphoribosylformylglycinamidine synthase subunit PurQ [Planctomycetaceae bacterium]|jgi:phosphoribosylformylglycinamidine synthase|nr:phosphoribosylformylglycinamidine synthase subunit PurQ [Planctomycetaceae bacterium]
MSAMSHVLILRAPGTNCDQETAYAFRLAGAKSVEILHINSILETPTTLDRANILCIPGGFSFGDDIAAGKIFALKIKNHLADTFRRFCDADKLILGICNGFQVLLKSGLLFEEDSGGSIATLTWNLSARYTDCWVHLQTEKNNAIFLRGIESMYLPIAHAEGRFVFRENVTQPLQQLALRYYSEENPNGSMLNVAGVCDISGRIFGLMPHPERYVDSTQHPHWTRKITSNILKHPSLGDGLTIFQNAVSYFQ